MKKCNIWNDTSADSEVYMNGVKQGIEKIQDGILKINRFYPDSGLDVKIFRKDW